MQLSPVSEDGFRIFGVFRISPAAIPSIICRRQIRQTSVIASNKCVPYNNTDTDVLPIAIQIFPHHAEPSMILLWAPACLGPKYGFYRYIIHLVSLQYDYFIKKNIYKVSFKQQRLRSDPLHHFNNNI